MLNLAAVEAAARKLADVYEPDQPRRARDLRQIAYDASCAGDPDYRCPMSLESVVEWYADDDELSALVEAWERRRATDDPEREAV